MWFAASLLGALLLQAPQQTAVDPTVQLEVAVRSYRSDGGSGGGASTSVSGSAVNSVWADTTACSVGAGSYRPASVNGIVWSSTGRIVRQTGDEYVIEIDVHRVDGPTPPLRTFTLRLNEPVVLEALPATAGRCGDRSFRLEAAVVPSTGRRGAGGGSRGAAASGVGVAGTGPRATAGGASGGVAASGSGGSTGAQSTAASAMASIQASLSGLGTSTTERSWLSTSRDGAWETLTGINLHAVRASYRAELWLVCTAPDGTQRTFPVIGHIADDGRTFQFGLIPIRIDDHPWMVLVAANLRPMATADGTPVLRAAIGRVVQDARPDQQPQSLGVSNRAVLMPGSGDVVSFELPPARDGLTGYHFDLRVRLTPAGAP